MFTDKSRYAEIETVETRTNGGRAITAIKLRRPPSVTGTHHTVVDNDRLDLLAQHCYGDGTRFWHIADANTTLEANEITAVTGTTLNLPET